MPAERGEEHVDRHAFFKVGDSSDSDLTDCEFEDSAVVVSASECEDSMEVVTEEDGVLQQDSCFHSLVSHLSRLLKRILQRLCRGMFLRSGVGTC
jgi:hypothetical protein